MKRIIQFLFLILLLSSLLPHVLAQKKKLTLKDAVIGQYQELRPADIRMIKWIPGTNKYAFAEAQKLKKSDASSGKTENILSLNKLNQILNLNKKDQLSSLPGLTWLNSKIFHFKHHNKWYKVNPYQDQLISSIQFDEIAANEDYCKDNDHIAFTIKNNLYITSYSGNTIQVTNESNQDIVSGQEANPLNESLRLSSSYSRR